jgi:predicted secreted protein
MFNDNRGKRIVVLAHCLLNQNSISDGTADFPAQFREVVDLSMDHRIGIVQLPCPEFLCLGLDRGDRNGASRDLLRENSRIRNLMESPENIAKLEIEARKIADQLAEYRKHGFDIAGLIGINRSPSCGVETTTTGDREVPGKGVLMEILLLELAGRGIDVEAIGIKTSEVADSADKTKRLLSKYFPES